MGIAKEIEMRIRTALSPETLEIIDESEKHRGHAGYRDGGESHWRVRIRASRLDDLPRIGRHRAVHDAVGKDLMERIHAFAIEFA